MVLYLHLALFFTDPKLLALRDEILHYGICDPAEVTQEFGIHDKIVKTDIVVRSKTKGNNGVWTMTIEC